MATLAEVDDFPARLRAFDSGFARIVDPGTDCSRLRIPECRGHLIAELLAL